MSKFCRVLTVLLIFWMLALPVHASAGSIAWPTTPEAANRSGRWPTLAEIKCSAYIVMNRSTGAVILEKQPDLVLFPASTTKVMTALLALEKLDLNKTVTISETAVTVPAGATKVGFKAGEKVVVKDLLAGMMVPSGNDAANAVAEAVSGSIAQFGTLMTERARKIGAKNTTFVNPSGLHDEKHVTTARDLGLITIEAMKNPLFRELVSLKSCSLPATNLHPFNGWAVLTNTNRLMDFYEAYFKSDLLRSVTGVKTGTTTPAGSCLIAAATTVSGVELIAVILKMPTSTSEPNASVYMRTLLEEGARKTGAHPTATTTTTAATTTATTSATTTATSQSALTTTGSSQTTGSSGQSVTTAATGGSQTTATGSQSSNTPENAGLLEDLRQRLGVGQDAFLIVTVIIGIVVGILIGLLLVLYAYRATHKRNRIIARRVRPR